jgi:hypothetical protein
MANGETELKKTDKQKKTHRPWLFQPGQSGNPNGRPKRKTLTELIHAKLDDTPDAWNTIVDLVVEKIKTDKDVLKIFWEYTDGKPQQKTDITSGGKPIPILGNVSTDDSDKETAETQEKD